MAASSFLRFPPYIYFRFGRKWPSVTVLAVFSERELKFTFAICRRPSVCRRSTVCRLSVCNVRAPYSDD